MAGIAESVAAKLIGYLMDPVVPHCGYVMFTDHYVRELDEEVEYLESLKQSVQHDIESAQRYLKRIKEVVGKWMEEAKTATEKARLTLAHDGGARETCFCECLPNLKELYRLGRDAKRTAEVIKELIRRGQFARVAYENDPPGRVGGANDWNSLVGGYGGNTITDSRASIFEGIIKALDDENKKVIGVYGAGGMGKTTLLKEVEKKLRKEGRPFHTIAYSKVSQKPDLKNIQNDIAYAFGVKLEPSEVGGRDLLSKKLKEDLTEKVLIILDDLWDKLDLEAVGIPSGDESAKCKLLLTSREKSVLQQMGAHVPFHLTGLSYDEAFRLFEETYGDELQADNGLKAKADQVVAKLAGSPLFIKSVASTLKRGDESTWDTALIKIEDPSIKSIVEWSYGRLKSSETESLFLVCGFVGGSIPVELLLGLGMGLGLFERFDKTIQSSRSKLNEMLRRLRSICLLLDGSGDEKNVTIHDLYSEEVISNSLTGQNSLMTHHDAGSWPKKKLEKCWVCLVNVGSDRLAELRLYRFPDSKIFMLSEQRDERGCHGLDFASMKELRVLYLRSINFTSFRSSVEIGKQLQILSFAGSSISSMPQEIGKLTKLKLLNLTNCYKLRKIEPGVLKGLTNLEELYMRRSFDKWMGKDEISSEEKDEISSELCNAKLAELKSLTKLSTLEISIRDPTVLLEDGDLPLGNLIRFWINIGYAYEGVIGLTAMMLDLEKCNSILSKEWVQKSLQKTQYLRLNRLREFEKKSANKLCSQEFPKLKHLVIQNCSFEQIVSSSNGAFQQLKHLDIQNCSSIKHIVCSSNGAFPLLESLSLENLCNLKKICDGPGCFSKLKAMRVAKCDQLEYTWCLSHIHRLAQMEEIKVLGCDSMQAIFIEDARKDIVVADNRVELPNVRRLELAKLPKMMSFCIGAGITSHSAPIQVSFPRLESLVMVGLLDLEKILYGQPPLEYSKNLKSIEIRESKSTLSSILKSDWILKWPNLESLKIEDFPSAEVVFDLEELKGMGHVKILSRLTTLQLDKLPNLKRMCKEDAQLQGLSIFPNLQKLCVRDTGLTFLFSVSVAKCLKEIRDIELRDCEKMEALVVNEDGRDEGTNNIIEFPLLERLMIMDCPVMKSFSYFHGKKELVPISLPSSALRTYDSQDQEWRDLILRDIMSALDDEENKVIGICGPGGVGKTMFLETLEKKFRNEKRPFHVIAKAKVSEAPDLKKIQRDIAHAFSLNLKDEPHEADRRDLLLKKLQRDPREKVLVILDDLSKKLDLGAVGNPSEYKSSGCQVLLTSRYEGWLHIMRASYIVHLEGLSTKETFRLFEKTYGPDKPKDEGLKAKADQVVAKLPGLPLLIKSVASTLKYGDESTWDNALIKIKGLNIEGILEWSYGHLESEKIKSLFLLCGFVGGSIPVELLLGLGMSFSLFEGFHKEVRSSRNKLNDMLRRLRSRCLLQDGGDDKENVTVHDFYSSVVISTPLTGQNSLMTHSNAGPWPKEKLEKCWVYLVNVGSDRLAELRLHWFPDSKIFLSSEQHDIGGCIELDFTSLKELRVLYLRSINFTSFRSSVEILKNLQSLYLDDCDVEDVAILGELKALQILSFAKSMISSLPKEIGKLTKLKLLNLSYCYNLWKIEPGILGGLINLEELYMRESFDKWKGEDEVLSESYDAKLVELKSLTKLTALEISIRDPTILLEDGDLPFGNLIRFWINIGNADKGEFEGLTAMMLDLEGFDGILSKEWVQKTLQKTQYLHLDGLRVINKSAYEVCGRGFPQLKHLEIQNCSSIEHIVISSNGAFPLLESLFLENMTNLEKICDGPGCFSKLKAIRVTKCNQLKYLWCLSQMHRLTQLEEIEVCRCDSMRAIAIDDARKDIVVADNRVELPNVRRLELAELPKMTSLFIEAEITSHGAPIQVWCPRLEYLVMVGLLDLEEILYSQLSLKYSSLKSIEIRESRSTSSILISDWILKLRNLESLQIRRSPSAEAFFCLEERKVMGYVEILSRLLTLELSELPNMGRMLKQDAQLPMISVFRNLKELKVIDTGLTFLFPVSVAKCLREITEIEVRNCKNMEALVVDEDGRDEGTSDIIEFPELKQLYIINCPMKKFFSYSHGKKEAITVTSYSDSQDAYSDSFFDQKVIFPSLRELNIEGVQCKELWNNQIHDNSFCYLRSLRLVGCDNLRHVAPSHMWKRLQYRLKYLEVTSCHSIQIIYESDATADWRRLILKDLENLRHIWRYDSLSDINVPFPNLRDIEVRRCPHLRMLFETFTTLFIGQIKWLEVESCDDMELIADHGECEGATCTIITFSELSVLKLKELPKFRGYLPEKYHVEFPSHMRALVRVGCGKEPDQSYGSDLVD